MGFGAVARLTLLIGERASSEGSFQAWLALRQAGLAFDERHVSTSDMGEPSVGFEGPPPVLLVDDVPIWGVPAIGEFLAEHVPSLWPHDPRARAMARSVAYEAHGALGWLRVMLPFDVTRRFVNTRLPRPVQRDLRRVVSLWRACRQEFGGDGSFLFGAFSLADVLHAGLAMRLIGHAVRTEGEAESYLRSIANLSAVAEWVERAVEEQGPDGPHRPGRARSEGASASAGASVEHHSRRPQQTIGSEPVPASGAERAVKPIGAGTRRRH